MNGKTLEKMTNRELDRLLQQELDKEFPDGPLVRQSIRLLRDREKDIPISPTVQAVWDRPTCVVREVKPRTRLIRAAAIAAVVCLVLLALIPQPAQAETWWEKLSRWTESVFEYFSWTEQDEPHAGYRFETDDPGLQKVYDTIADLGVTDPVVPMWLPEGYALTECTVTPTPANTWVLATFSRGTGEWATLSVAVYSTDTWHEYHKDEQKVVTYETHGVSHYIMRNLDRYVVIWEQERVECSLTIDCQEDVLYEIIDSLYTAEEE